MDTLLAIQTDFDRLKLEEPKVVDDKVSAAHAAKQHADQLLDVAKRAVEIAIEDSKAAALKYLEVVAPRSALPQRTRPHGPSHPRPSKKREQPHE